MRSVSQAFLPASFEHEAKGRGITGPQQPRDARLSLSVAWSATPFALRRPSKLGSFEPFGSLHSLGG